MNLEKRVNAFVRLGHYLDAACLKNGLPEESLTSLFAEFQILIKREKNFNNFFTPENVLLAIGSLADMLQEKNLNTWLLPYKEKLEKNNRPTNIGVVMAGNIPMVGFHDMLCVLLSGCNFIGKLASGDVRLLPHLVSVLVVIEPEFKSRIHFVERITDVAAIIATGGNNSSRYFDYYFAKYPHIIRKNRNAVAVLSGLENTADFLALGKDIFHYFGLGCRSVSKIYVPQGYDFIPFIEGLNEFQTVADHTKYRNNYDYNKALLLINKIHHFDNGFILIKEDHALVSPISVLFYEMYSDKNQLENELAEKATQLQCVVAQKDFLKNSIPFGSTQSPALWDYADGVDTMAFLLNQGFDS
jgi:hypothetical protein